MRDDGVWLLYLFLVFLGPRVSLGAFVQGPSFLGIFEQRHHVLSLVPMRLQLSRTETLLETEIFLPRRVVVFLLVRTSIVVAPEE